MATKALPSQEALRQLLDYDPETGALTWCERGPEWFSDSGRRSARHSANLWNAIYAGKSALTALNTGGYFQGPVLGRNSLAHRVIWKWMTGEEPKQVDHINGVRTENRWANLRAATAMTNAQNTKRRCTNASGMMGVQFFPYQRKTPVWVARIGNKHIGCFKTKEEAMAARQKAEQEMGYHENHGRVS